MQAQPQPTEPPRGVVAALFIKPERHEPMEPVHDAGVRARHGLIGDCHAQPLGPRQLLIVREESLADLGVAAWQVRANIATRGLAEADLDSGAVLRVGEDVRIRITHVCEVCKVLRQYVAPDVFRSLPGRRGSLGVFVSGGTIALGDPVLAEPERYPVVPERVYERLAWVVERIPRGRILTYDMLLTLVGATKQDFRVLPTYLKRAAATGLPAHRVLTTAGEVTRHLPSQRRALLAEGVELDEHGRLLDGALLWDARRLYLATR